jgi:hypothetical protein
LAKLEHTATYLLSTYPGGEAWHKYAEERRSEWEARQDRDYFAVFFQDEELAIVLAWHFHRHAFEWFDSTQIPALYGFSPRQLWQQGESGRDSLRSLLMRQPGRQ